MSEMVLGIRPDDIFLEKKRTAKGCVKAEVYVTEAVGSESIVDLKVADEIAKAKTSPSLRISIGEEV